MTPVQWASRTADASFASIYALKAVEIKCLLPSLLAHAGEEVGPLWPRQDLGLHFSSLGLRFRVGGLGFRA